MSAVIVFLVLTSVGSLGCLLDLVIRGHHRWIGRPR